MYNIVCIFSVFVCLSSVHLSICLYVLCSFFTCYQYFCLVTFFVLLYSSLFAIGINKVYTEKKS